MEGLIIVRPKTTQSYSFFAAVFVVLFFCGFLIFAATTQAQSNFNDQINYQGKLTDSIGATVPDGTYNMRFWLLNSPSIATTSAEWVETLTTTERVQVTSGLFSVMLGSSSPLSNVDFNQTLYLGVEIGSTTTIPAWDGEMSPRKVLGAVPAAFEAQNAQTLGGIATSSFLRADVPNSAAALITFFWGSLQLPFIAIAFSRIVDGWYAGREPTAREALGHALRHAPAALAAWVLVHLIEAAGLVTLGLFTLVAMTWFAVTAPVIGFEGVGPLAAMGRAFRLSSKAFWFTVGAAVLVGVVEGFLGLGFAALPSAAATLLGSSWGWLLIAAGSMIGSLVTVTFVAGTSVVLYLALRIRVEGLDLELRSRELGGSEPPR